MHAEPAKDIITRLHLEGNLPLQQEATLCQHVSTRACIHNRARQAVEINCVTCGQQTSLKECKVFAGRVLRKSSLPGRGMRSLLGAVVGEGVVVVGADVGEVVGKGIRTLVSEGVGLGVEAAVGEGTRAAVGDGVGARVGEGVGAVVGEGVEAGNAGDVGPGRHCQYHSLCLVHD